MECNEQCGFYEMGSAINKIFIIDIMGLSVYCLIIDADLIIETITIKPHSSFSDIHGGSLATADSC